jgi:hypothetical protein
MKTKSRISFIVLVMLALSALSSGFSTAHAQGTAFNYQGQLNADGTPATGKYDFIFTLYANSTGTPPAVAGPLTNTDVPVANGSFTTTLDFGPDVFTGPSFWLLLEVRTNTSGASFTNLAPLQPVLPAPYAIYAGNAGSAASVAAANVSGTLGLGQLPGGLLTNGQAGVTLSGTFSGNGANLTSLNANNLSSGTVPLAQLSGITSNQLAAATWKAATDSDGGNAALASNVVSGIAITNATITNAVITGSSFAGNGAGLTNLNASQLSGELSGNGSELTSLNASQLTSGAVPAAVLGYAWQIAGNTGTEPGLDFIGTRDYQPLELWVNDGRALRLEPGVNGDAAPNVIGGSLSNYVLSGVTGATIAGGGATNYMGYPSGAYGIVYSNRVTADFGSVGGGLGNAAGGPYATIAGGGENSAGGNSSTVAGGYANTASSYAATVGGGDGNTASGESGGGGTVAGGAGNYATGDYSTVSGGYDNQALEDYATIGGGVQNQASSPNTMVSGGNNNTIRTGAGSSYIGGGQFNMIDVNSFNSMIGGGYTNHIESDTCTISGGAYNFIATNSFESFIGGGEENYVDSTDSASGSAQFATVGGGKANSVYANFGTVPGGYDNSAGGVGSFAAGNQAKALHQGAFVWADSQDAGFASSGNDQFCIRAQGGVQLDPTTSLVCGTQTRQMLNLYSSTYGIGVQNDDMYFRTDDEFWWYKGGSHSDEFGNAGGGTMLMRLGATGNLIIAGTLTQNSDRNVKGGFQPVDSRLVLEKIAAMPFTRWHYTNNVATPHVGPMAQDFYAAFGLGEDDKHITTVDEGGIALAAIQGLNQKMEDRLKEKDAEIEKLKAKADKVDALEQQLNELKQMVQLLAVKK